MKVVVDSCIASIRNTQAMSREGTLKGNPRFPMIVLRTPKGWNSIKAIRGKRIEDNHYSHQVIADLAKTDEIEREALEAWLRSYNFNELFDGEHFHKEIEDLIPAPALCMGNNAHTMGGDPYYKPLNFPSFDSYVTKGTCRSDGGSVADTSSMEAVGKYVRDIMKDNMESRNFRIFSPDETYSNKLDAVFDVTDRAFVWPKKPWDKNIANDGRVLEMLSEHSLQGLMQGYVLTGRHGLFASYEAFMQIVASMADQYAKFLSIAREIEWRGDVPSLNYILTSGAWRQEHNGFSHQNPGFIDDMLQRQGNFVNIYFPSDANTALVVTEKTLKSKNEMNILVLEKRPVPAWRSIDEATRDVEEGISIWDFASNEDPHMVFAAIGDYLTKETLAAITIVRHEVPEMRMRFVNIVSLSAKGIGDSGCRELRHGIQHYFTDNKKVIINFHGYPQTIKQILFDYGCSSDRFSIHGYEEHGSTTTPFDMQIRNHTDRYHLAMEAFVLAEEQGVITREKRDELVQKFEKKLADHRAFIMEKGADPIDVTNWSWTSPLL